MYNVGSARMWRGYTDREIKEERLERRECENVRSVAVRRGIFGVIAEWCFAVVRSLSLSLSPCREKAMVQFLKSRDFPRWKPVACSTVWSRAGEER